MSGYGTAKIYYGSIFQNQQEEGTEKKDRREEWRDEGRGKGKKRGEMKGQGKKGIKQGKEDRTCMGQIPFSKDEVCKCKSGDAAKSK